MTKLNAIWKIITSEYFLVLTGGGSVTAIMPKNLEHLKLMQSIAEAAEKIKNPSSGEIAKGEGKV